jgi:hypothetical protein
MRLKPRSLTGSMVVQSAFDYSWPPRVPTRVSLRKPSHRPRVGSAAVNTDGEAAWWASWWCIWAVACCHIWNRMNHERPLWCSLRPPSVHRAQHNIAGG